MTKFCFLYCRKGLVKLFDKVERGQMKEGAKFSNLVKAMHQDRWLKESYTHLVLRQVTKYAINCFAGKVHRGEGRDQHRGLKDVLGLELKKPFMRIHTLSVFAVQRSTKNPNWFYLFLPFYVKVWTFFGVNLITNDIYKRILNLIFINEY